MNTYNISATTWNISISLLDPLMKALYSDGTVKLHKQVSPTVHITGGLENHKTIKKNAVMGSDF